MATPFYVNEISPLKKGVSYPFCLSYIEYAGKYLKVALNWDKEKLASLFKSKTDGIFLFHSSTTGMELWFYKEQLQSVPVVIHKSPLMDSPRFSIALGDDYVGLLLPELLRALKLNTPFDLANNEFNFEDQAINNIKRGASS